MSLFETFADRTRPRSGPRVLNKHGEKKRIERLIVMMHGKEAANSTRRNERILMVFDARIKRVKAYLIAENRSILGGN